MEDMKISHTVSISERTAILLTGIESIEGFDEENIVMKTSSDGLSIQGHGLHVDKFDADTGELICSGTLDAIVYYDLKKRSDKKHRNTREK